MDKDKARRYREDIKTLTASQNSKTPMCPYDKKPCYVHEAMGCQVVLFGSFAVNGNEEVLWTCPRLKF